MLLASQENEHNSLPCVKIQKAKQSFISCLTEKLDDFIQLQKIKLTHQAAILFCLSRASVSSALEKVAYVNFFFPSQSPTTSAH